MTVYQTISFDAPCYPLEQIPAVTVENRIENELVQLRAEKAMIEYVRTQVEVRLGRIQTQIDLLERVK